MTIGSSSPPRVVFNCDGVSKVFPIPIQAYQATDLTVILSAPISSGGAEVTLVLNSDYSLAPSGTLQPQAWVLTTIPLAAYLTGYTLQTFIDPVVQQQTQYVQGQAFPSLAIQTNLDRLTQMVQRLQDQATRSVHTPDGDNAPTMQLPTAIARANTNLGFDANGNISVSQTLVAGVLSQASIVFFLGADPIQRRTALEIAAGVTPINYAKWASPWKDISRFVTDNTGGPDVSGQFALALAAEKNIIVPQGTYNLGTTGIVLPSNTRFQGGGRGNTFFTYGGTGIAIDGFSTSQVEATDFTLTTTNVVATGMRFGNSCQHIHLSDIEMHGNTTAANTGIGLLLDAGNPGAFSGNLLAQLFYSLGYKWGVKCTGHDAATNTWTSMSFLQCFIIGRGSGIIAGSAGLWMDANTNGVGSVFHGGSIEGFDIGLQVDNGGFGLDFAADLEGNNTQYTVGATFAGRIKQLNSTGSQYEASANGVTNRWFARSQLNGVLIDESYFEHDIVLYDSGGFAPVSIYRGASLANGGTPTLKFQFATGNSSSDNGANRNYLQFPTGTRIFSGTGSPEGAVTAPVGSLYMRVDGGAGTSLYVKETGVSSTGWIGK